MGEEREEKNLFSQMRVENSSLGGDGWEGKPFVVKLDFHFENIPPQLSGESSSACCWEENQFSSQMLTERGIIFADSISFAVSSGHERIIPRRRSSKKRMNEQTFTIAKANKQIRSLVRLFPLINLLRNVSATPNKSANKSRDRPMSDLIESHRQKAIGIETKARAKSETRNNNSIIVKMSRKLLLFFMMDSRPASPSSSPFHNKSLFHS